MKKRTTSKTSQAHAAVDQDVVGLITTLVQRLVSLETKIDTVLSRISQRPFEAPRQQPMPAPSAKQRTDTRTMYKAICADCNKECEVPFRPSGDRPVYCKGCFAARKNKGAGQPPAHVRPPEKPQTAAPEKPVKKKLVAKKKKKK